MIASFSFERGVHSSHRHIRLPRLRRLALTSIDVAGILKLLPYFDIPPEQHIALTCGPGCLKPASTHLLLDRLPDRYVLPPELYNMVSISSTRSYCEITLFGDGSSASARARRKVTTAERKPLGLQGRVISKLNDQTYTTNSLVKRHCQK